MKNKNVKCPKCFKRDQVCSNGKKQKQFYCKRCGKYFNPYKINKYSKPELLILKAIRNLVYRKSNNATISLKEYKTLADKSFLPDNPDIKINYKTIPDTEIVENETSVFVDSNLKGQTVILSIKGDEITIINGLDVRKKVEFKDFTIHISKDNIPIKRDYYLAEKIENDKI